MRAVLKLGTTQFLVSESDTSSLQPEIPPGPFYAFNASMSDEEQNVRHICMCFLGGDKSSLSKTIQRQKKSLLLSVDDGEEVLLSFSPMCRRQHFLKQDDENWS